MSFGDQAADASDPAGSTDEPLESQLQSVWPLRRWSEHRMLIAVSGGCDSVALLRALHQQAVAGGLGERIAVAHFDHGWREESAEDAEFVRTICRQREIVCELGRAEPGSARDEQTARRQRYEFLSAAAGRLGARYLATAHTANDQAETVLHQIVRGTSLRGVAGMRPVRVLHPGLSLIRPILHCRRQAVLEYLERIGQSYREDATNADWSWLRNRIRGELLPLLARHYNPQVEPALIRLAGLAREGQQVVDEVVGQLVEQAKGVGPEGQITLCREALRPAGTYLRCEVLRLVWEQSGWARQTMSYERWVELAGLIDEPGSLVLPGGLRARSDGEVLRLTPAR